MSEAELRTEIRRTPWDHTFLNEAWEWSKKSHDADTQCGCVLVRDKTLLSSGYNGFIRNIDDKVLPNIRPHKYPFMIHAEINAVLNCARLGLSTQGATCYVTTKPCLQCFQFLHQAGIERIVYSNMSHSQNYNHGESDNQIEGLMRLINMDERQLTLDFIDKNYVLPN